MKTMSIKKRVSDVMISASRVPVVQSNDNLKSALDVMTKFSLGVCIIENDTGVLEGIMSDDS